jgi:sporulation protein YlmC with PRC-barrel domain
MEVPMVLHHTVFCAALVLGAVPAQSAQPDRTGQEGKALEQDKPDKDKHPPGRTEPVLMKLAAVLGTELVNSKVEKLGKVTDLVVDAATGKTLDAVVAVSNDKKVKLRWELVTWDPATKRFCHEGTREQLERAPAYKPESPEPGAIKDTKGDQPKDRDGDGDPEGAREKAVMPADTLAAAPSGGTRLASNLATLRVAAGTDDLGTPGDVYLELRTGCLAFVTLTLGDVIGIGGKTYLVPWMAMHLQTGSDQKSLLKIQSMDRKKLETAPRQEGKDDVHNASFRGRLYQFFGVKIPAYEPEHDLLGAAGKAR